jgi:hypothetical protein
MKVLITAFLLALILCGLTNAGYLPFGNAQTGTQDTNITTSERSWVTQRIFSGLATLNFGVSIALDSDTNPHICWTSSGTNLMYTSWTGTDWSTNEVNSSGWDGILAIDTNNVSHICFNDLRLQYAVWNGSGWNTQIVDPTEHHGGAWYSFALDSKNNPHIVYSEDHMLIHASLTGANWSMQTVDISADIFLGISLAFDKENNLHIMYDDATSQKGYNGGTKYAYWTGSGWNTKIVIPNNPPYAHYVSPLALDSKGYPHVSIVERGWLYHVSWDGKQWNKENLTIRSFDSVLALDSKDNPHIFYYTDDNFGYVSWNGSYWIEQTIASRFNSSDYETVKGADMVIDAYGNSHVSYLSGSYRYGGVNYVTYAEPIHPPQNTILEFLTWATVSVAIVVALIVVIIIRKKPKQSG